MANNEICWDEVGRLLWAFAGGMFVGAFTGLFFMSRMNGELPPAIGFSSNDNEEFQWDGPE